MNKLLSWDRDSADAAANTVSSINTARTPSQVHSLHLYPPVPVPQIFTHRESEPSSPLHKSSPEIMTPKGNPTSRNNPPDSVTNVPADPDSDTILSDNHPLD